MPVPVVVVLHEASETAHTAASAAMSEWGRIQACTGSI